MRRVLIISMAILFVFATSSSLLAGEQQVSDRLLEILKQRQIISEDEYGELKALANKMQEDQSEADQKLAALDRSVSEYLSKEGDAAGVATTHKKGKGFGFSTGNFSLFIGGLFQFEYAGIDFDEGIRDNNSFNVKENRFEFFGSAFIEEFTYKFQWQGNGGVTLLDAYGNWDSCEWADFMFGQFKVPVSRQYMTSVGKLGFADRAIATNLAPKRDIGVMAHKNLTPMDDDFVLEYMAGLWNGDGTNVSGNDNNWVAYGGRLGVYPMGHVAYSEGDFNTTQDMMFGIAGSYYAANNRTGGTDVDTTIWALDGVFVWNGIYFTAEYIENRVKPTGVSSQETTGWFAQAGWMIPDTDLEVLGRYGDIDWDGLNGLDDTTEWQIGLAWYIQGNGHPFKVVFAFGQIDTDVDSGSGGSGGGSFAPQFVYEDDGKTNFFRVIFQLDW